MRSELTLLEKEIMSDIEARNESLLHIKTLAFRYTFSKHDRELLLQHSIPMVYSIWEGFIQTAFQIYIRELNKLELTIDTVCKPLLIRHIEAEFKQFKQYPKDYERKKSFFEQLNQFYVLKIININPIVNTESNVGFKVLNRILKEFNLEEIPEYPEPKYSLKIELDGFFLKIRNSVAHGQNAIIVSQEYLERTIKLVNKLMELVFEKIKKGFIEQSYLKNNQ